MSAFDRHPLRAQYEAARKSFPPKNRLEMLRHPTARPKYLSAQNRRVRFAVDMQLARARS